MLAHVAGGTHVDPARLTEGEFLVGKWLPSLPGRVRATTATAYKRAVNKFVPSLGPLQLQGLGAGDVQAVLAEMSGGGLKPKTVRNHAGVLSKALSDAVRWGLVGRNVVSGALDLPQVPPAAPRAWDAAQVAKLLAGTATSDLGLLWRFVVIAGCRRGEALGLQWSSVDLDVGTICFVSQRVIACGGGGVIEGPPKTRAGARTVRLDAETVRQLRGWNKGQLEELVRLGVRPDHNLVFTGPGVKGLWPPQVTARFQKAALELGWPSIGVHGLRYSSASWLIDAGVSPKTVSQRLGHSTQRSHWRSMHTCCRATTRPPWTPSPLPQAAPRISVTKM